MLKRAFIIHGWDGFPEEGWYLWLKRELEVRGFKVFVPQMPKPDEPRIKTWVPAIKEIAGEPDEQTYLIGHSMGCQAIARYLVTLPDSVKAGGAVFVAGFFKRLTNLEDDEVVRDVVNEWLKTPIDLEKVKVRLNRSTAIFSDDDPYVPLDNQDQFAEILESKIIIKHKQGHFSASTETTGLPCALEAVLEMAEIIK